MGVFQLYLSALVYFKNKSMSERYHRKVKVYMSIRFPLDSILEVSVSVSGFFSRGTSEGSGVNYLATLPRQQNTLIAFNWPIVSSLICSLGSDISMLAATLTPHRYTPQKARNYWPTAEKC